MEPEYISHSFIAVMPKDSIRLPIILLVLERIRSESQIWKITGHAYRGQRLANDTWVGGYSQLILHIHYIYIFAFAIPRSIGHYVKYVKNAMNPNFELSN